VVAAQAKIKQKEVSIKLNAKIDIVDAI